MNVHLMTSASQRTETSQNGSSTCGSHPLVAKEVTTPLSVQRLIVARLVLALAITAVAPASAAALVPATTLFKPGTSPALGPPDYSTVLPAYFVPVNVVAGPMVSAYAPLTPSITGVLTSTVYRNPATGFLGFQYHFTSTGVSDLIRASMGGFAWTGVTIFNAGADGSGSSTPGTVAPFWSDGDPNFLLRDPVISGEGLTIQWRALSKGTALRAGNSSSLIFYETNWETVRVVNVGLIDSGAVSTASAFAPGLIQPSLDIEKHTNGQDADAAPGPFIPVGGAVLWEYIVTNTGNVTLTNIAVTDDVLGPIGVIASLAPGASQTLTANGTAAAAQHANIGTASGSPPVGPDVSDSDPSHYFSERPAAPAITIQKEGAELEGNTRTIGFWKNNILKHIQHKTTGFQVSYANLLAWLRAVQLFYRPDPFVLGATDAQILQNAYNVLSYSGSNMASKTRRQLIGSELNLLSGTYALADVAAHEALCKLAEDLLNTPGADLAFIHNLLDVANNVGESGGYPGPVCCGSTVLYTITVTAKDLAPPTAVAVKDCLDTALLFLVADAGGVYSAGTHCVAWNLLLPAGDSITVLHVWVRLLATPVGDGGHCPEGWTSSNVVELPFCNKRGEITPAPLKNSACFKEN